MGNEVQIIVPVSMRNSEKYSELDAGFISVKPDSILIYGCHLFDVCSAKFPTLLNLVRKEEYLTERLQAIFQG